MKSRAVLALCVLGLVSLAAGYGVYRGLQPGGGAPETLPDIVLNDLDGRPHRLSEWDGKIVLLNFWATWCAPCLKEIPLLMKTQDRLAPQGFHVVGIAMDQVAPVRAFVQRLGINYPILVGEADVANAMDALGDQLGALPFSVLVAPNGKILRRVSGDLSEEELEQLLGEHLRFR